MRYQKQFFRSLFFVFLLICLLTGLAGIVRVPVNAAPMKSITGTDIVISQVYGGGGNAGATYSNDFVELFNPSDTDISFNNWSIQYASAQGSSWTVTAINGTIAAGQYYLVQLASGGGTGELLPTPDATGTTNLNATMGKVALVNTIIALIGSGCPIDTSVVDFVGYGTGTTTTPNCSEGDSVAPAPPSGNNTTASLRNINGCTDTDNNGADFLTGTPNPRNIATILTCANAILTATEAANLTGTAAANVPTAAPPLSVLINEVAWGGTEASNTDEWFELYNPGSSNIDLTGWSLIADDGAPEIFLSGTIFAEDYFVVARYSAVFNDLTPDLTYSASSFNNSGEILYLLDPNGNQVDTANLDGNSWPAGSGSPNFATMERQGIVADNFYGWATYAGTIPVAFDRNNNPIQGTPGQANWITTVTITPSPTNTPTRTPTITRTPTLSRTPTKTRTPTVAPTVGPPPLVAINEFVPRPGRDWNNDGVVNTNDEYIEILNHGVINVNLSGYSLDDEANIGSSPFRLPSITLKPGERIVFYGSQTGLLLSDGGDGVRLLKSNGQLVDAYNYFFVDRPDQAYCRLPDNGGLDDWNQNCYPTPGLPNALRGNFIDSPVQSVNEPLCPIADTLPQDFAIAECSPFGNNIWSRYYWDRFGWYGERSLPDVNSKWDVYLD